MGLLGTGTKNQYEQLLSIKCNNYVLALDPDDAGRNGIRKLINFLLQHNLKNIYVALLPEGKDINDLTTEEFKTMEIAHYKEWLHIYGSNLR